MPLNTRIKQGKIRVRIETMEKKQKQFLRFLICIDKKRNGIEEMVEQYLHNIKETGTV